MRIFKIILLFIANLLIDLAILSKYNIYGVLPSISIPMIVVISMYYRSEKILYFSIFQGLFQDIAFNKVLGSSSLILYLISYYTRERDYKKNFSIWHGFIFTFLGVLLSKISIFIINFISRNSIIYSDVKLFLINILLELLIALVFYFIIYFIFYYLRKRKLRHYI